MPHPLLHLAATRPQLLLEHLEAYAELAGAELAMVSTGWKRSAVMKSAAFGCLIMAVTFGGVALMLWAVVPSQQMTMPWMLIAVPVVPLLIALVCLASARKETVGNAFDHVRRQIKADMAVLREADAI